MKKLISNFIILIIVIIIILVIYEFNTKYINNSLINFSDLLSNNNGNLIVSTHDYEHKDIFIMLNELSKLYYNKFYVLFADKIWNILLEPLRPKNVEFIYVKNNTVNKLSSKIILGHNVVMFLYKESESSGIYHILKNTNCNLILTKINKNNKNNNITKNHTNSSKLEIFLDNFNSSYNFHTLQYKYDNSINSKLFMNNLKNVLYLKS